MRLPINAAFAAVAVLTITQARAETLHYFATLGGAAEKPANASKGVGFADMTLDTDNRTISWRITYSGLSGPAVAAHFHGPAGPGATGPVTVAINDPFASPMIGTAPVNFGQIGDLRAGLWYVNIHTLANPKGEIRGQLSRAH